jgi:pyridoxamine 5'-phosphate oxidase
VDEHEIDPNPMRQFAVWYTEAESAGLPQPDATALATATKDGHPSVRMVLLKGYDDHGFVFYTNHESRKGDELAANPHAALVVYWQPLHRQVRVEGRAQRIPDGESAAYFATRPRGSQVAAWASPQSSVVLSRADLDRLYEETDARLGGDDIPLPPFWGGYRIVPIAIEFWQGRENRLHDRVRYERSRDGWARERLAP